MAVTALSIWRPKLIASPLRLTVALVTLVAVGFGGYYAVRYVEAFILLSSVVGAHNFEEDEVKNQRGDTVFIRTDVSERLQDPDKTVVRLRRAQHWLSTILVEVDSLGIEENLKWLNDDNLDVSLGFGCLVHMTHPVEQVGPIHIAYHFRDGNKELSKGCPD
jgi:hypothetical protein